MTEIAVPTAADEPELLADPRSSAAPMIPIDIPLLRESSGLGVSRRSSERFWSHNDSGGKPQLFAFDATGKPTGRCRLIGAEAIDWEDMACYRDDTDAGGKARIVVADFGDNQRTRARITLYLFDEPDPNQATDVDDFQTISVSYPDGPQNCEAIAIDPARRQIVIVAKTALPFAGIYTIPLSSLASQRTELDNRQTESQHVTASRVGTIGVPLVTAMDIDPTNGDVWIMTYFLGYRFPGRQDVDSGFDSRAAPFSLATQLATTPQAIPLPRWKLIEAVAVDEDHNVWLTSEGSPTPFGKLPRDLKHFGK